MYIYLLNKDVYHKLFILLTQKLLLQVVYVDQQANL